MSNEQQTSVHSVKQRFEAAIKSINDRCRESGMGHDSPATVGELIAIAEAAIALAAVLEGEGRWLKFGEAEGK